MKRKSPFHNVKCSLFLFGMSAGLFSMVPATLAQTQLEPLAEFPPVVRSPRELMRAASWSKPSIAEVDKFEIRSPAMLERVMVNPDFAKTLDGQQDASPVQTPRQNSTCPIAVDSSVFSLGSKSQADTLSGKQPEIKQLQPLEFPVSWNPLQPIEQVVEAKAEAAGLDSVSEMVAPEPRENKNDHIAIKQVAASGEMPEAALPQASLAFLRKPMKIKDPTTCTKDDPDSKSTRIKPNALLQPIGVSASVGDSAKEKVTREVSLANAATYDFQTPVPTGPISLFVDGPDYLSINQIGEYEIAIANSSSRSSSVSSISLQVPSGVEVVAVQRAAEIDDLKRTLTWSIDKIGSGKQQRIRFRVKVADACKVNFPVTISQDGREFQTVSQATIVR